MEPVCESTSIVIFGASGDLTSRKLIPALYNNFKKGRLGECANIVGFARRPYTDETFRAYLREGVAQWGQFAALAGQGRRKRKRGRGHGRPISEKECACRG